VVGDEKQAIYRFQGASLENFLLFESHYHNTTVISLVDNYRSGQTILDAAHSLVAMDEGPLATLRLPLTACVVPDSHIRLTEYDHQAQEMNALTELIQDRIAAGVPAREIAVILTRNVDVEDVTRSLRAAGLAAVPSADSDILQHPVLRTIESLLRAAVLRDERALFDQLHAPYWGHASSDLVRLAGWRKSNQSLLHVIEQAVQAEPCDLQKPESLTNMLEVFRGASVRSLTDTPHAVLAWLLKKSGCIAMMMRNAPYDTTRVVRRVYDEIEGLVRRDGLETVEDVLGTLGARRAYGLPLVAPYVATDTDAVQVMTAHKSKGLEFDMVCLPRLSDANWGQDTARQVFKIPLHRHSAETTEDAAADDKKRLLYVALTRARKELHLSYANNNADGRPLTQSRLLSDIDETLIDRQTDHRPVDVLAGINAPTRRSLVDVPAATALFKERGFSATGLNNFLQSPYEYYFKNLLRIPEVQPDYLLYGTAVHSVLETFVRRGQAGEDARMTDHDVLQKIKQTLSALPLSATEYATRHEQALAALVPYTDHLRHTLPVKSRLEYSVRAIITVAGFDIPLVGNIDRLDFDESGQVTGIVDYKTGKVKSRRVIEGTNRDYKRQLLFYVYLLQQQPDSRLHTNTVTLAFVESAATGDIKEETFVISDQELQEFEVELRAAVAQMLSGEWAETPCTEADCEYWYLLQPITES
jgi:DNA helicase-2/ATP-dependent DNA helicase PcrA